MKQREDKNLEVEFTRYLLGTSTSTAQVHARYLDGTFEVEAKGLRRKGLRKLLAMILGQSRKAFLKRLLPLSIF